MKIKYFFIIIIIFGVAVVALIYKVDDNYKKNKFNKTPKIVADIELDSSMEDDSLQYLRKKMNSDSLEPNEILEVSNILQKNFPKLIDSTIFQLVNVTFRNDNKLLEQIYRSFREPTVPTEAIRKYIQNETGIGLTPISMQLWRDSYTRRMGVYKKLN